MFNPPPYVPGIPLSDTIPLNNSQFGHTPNLGIEVQRRTAELAERMGRRAKEDTDGDLESDYEDDGDRERDFNYEDRRTRPNEAVFFRRDQDDLDDMEIAHIERRVAEATRILEEAKRDLKEARMRIRNRRREERQRGRGNHSLPEFVRPSVQDERTRSMQDLRDYLSPAPKRTPPSMPQPSLDSLGLPPRSRSPSPYRFISKRESELPSESDQSRTRSRTRTPNPTGEEPASQEQVYESFSKIHDVAKEFQRLKENFVYPTVIEFQTEAGEIVSVRVPADVSDDEVESEEWGSEGKLAYTRRNERIHTYSYGLEKLLGKLDSVDSWNETSVRAQRRGIIGEIEEEASKLERYRGRVWREYCHSK